jgi:hypothetical protein
VGDSPLPARSCANADGVPAANQSHEVGNSDTARRFEILSVSLLLPGRCVRPWLPQLGRSARQHARLFPLMLSHLSSSLLVRGTDDGVNHGTARPSCRHSESAPACTDCPVTRSHRSRALPQAPQRKHCHTPRPRYAENARLVGDDERCTGHGPRACSPRRSRACQPRSRSTSARHVSERNCRKSMSGMATSHRPAQRRGTRHAFVAVRLPCQNRSSSNASPLRHRW